MFHSSEDKERRGIAWGFLLVSFTTALTFGVLPKYRANPCGWSWAGAPEGGAGLEYPAQQRQSWGFHRNPSALQTPGRDSLRSWGLWSCTPGFLCCCTLPGNFSLSFIYGPCLPHWVFSPHWSHQSLRVQFRHIILGDSFCLLKNTSLFFPCKGSHAGAHICFPQASTGSFTILNPGENWVWEQKSAWQGVEQDGF